MNEISTERLAIKRWQRYWIGRGFTEQLKIMQTEELTSYFHCTVCGVKLDGQRTELIGDNIICDRGECWDALTEDMQHIE
ncbi:MAG: hypothetical protein ACXADY_23095 [Candidatus Hodarchaeales archaeon]|jgi:hypothetical protein